MWDRAWDEDEDEYVSAQNADRKIRYCCRNKCMRLFLRSDQSTRPAHFWRGPGDAAKTCDKSQG